MHWHLIAGLAWFLEPANWLIVLEVAVGIGMVIFVHELGHFAVAKACGVKCEKFYLGFDIGGWKLCKFQWGETEYGIGVLPLGGYVKMLGQDDNPARQREETERAKLKPTPNDAEPVAPAAATATAADEPAAEAVFDPRSYLAKSVPQRMAIISAGVIMNVIFAFVASSIAFGIGVQQVACVVGTLLAGEPAWRAGLHEGDEIEQIGALRDPVFRDLQTGVALGDDLQHGVDFVVRRPGHSAPLKITVVPEQRRRHPTIGVTPGDSRTIADPPVLPFAELARHAPDLQPGDLVIAANGKPVNSVVDLDRELHEHPGEATISVERRVKGDSLDPEQSFRTTRVDVALPPIAMRTTGLVMRMGQIVAIQSGSPAEAADLRPGDRISLVDGQEIGDPMRLPERLRARADQSVKLTLEREGRAFEKEVELRRGEYDQTLSADNGPVVVPEFGLAYAVENVVAAVDPDSPAAAQGLKPGDEIIKASLIPPDDEVQRKQFQLQKHLQPRFDVDLEKERSWPLLFGKMQALQLPGTRLELTLKGGRTVTLEPKAVADWLNPDRGLIFEPVLVVQKADTLADALALGGRETKYSLSLVFRFLRKITSGQVSIKDMGGPVTIAKQAGATASEGTSQFLLFLAMLSANLAVLNFLPIPLLDGGHMVFLAAEGVRGKPVNEQVVAWFQFAGLFFLAGLMLFVFLLDVGLIPRG